jgi:hypothetical protein
MAIKVPFDSIYRPEFGQNRVFKRPLTNHQCEGLDTETEDGYALIISNSQKWQRINSLDEALDFLTSKEHAKKNNVFYNLRFDFEVIMKWDKEVMKQIGKTEKRDYIATAHYADYIITYIPQRAFTINKNKHHFKFYDISQFYRFKPLVEVTRIVLGKPPHPFKKERSSLFKKYTDKQIGEYCQDDSLNAKLLAEKYIQTINSVGFQAHRLTSPAYIAQENFLRLANIPTNYDVSHKVDEFYHAAFRGGWIDIYKKGTINCTHYDQRAAYAAQLKELPDLREGRFEVGFDENAPLGVLKCELESYLKICNPISYQWGKDRKVYPYFDKPTEIYLTLAEYLAYKDFMKIKIIESHYFKAKEGYSKPFEAVIDAVWKEKRRHKEDSIEAQILKDLPNAIYGKLLQLNEKEGINYWSKLYLPVYATTTTAGVRASIFNHIKDKMEKVICISTDAIFLEGDVKLPTSENIGGLLRKHHNQEGLFIFSGVYQFKGEPHAKLGGYSGKVDLFKACDIPSTKINLPEERPIHIREAMRKNKLDQVGIFQNHAKYYDVNHDFKRIWHTPLNEAVELLERKFEDSEPYTLNDLQIN